MKKDEQIQETAALLGISIEEAKCAIGFVPEFSTIKEARDAFMSDGPAEYRRAGWEAWERITLEHLANAKTAGEVAEVYRESPHGKSGNAAMEKQARLSLAEVKIAQTIAELKLLENSVCGESVYLLLTKWSKFAKTDEDRRGYLRFIMRKNLYCQRIKNEVREVLANILMTAEPTALVAIKSTFEPIIKCDQKFFSELFILKQIRDATTNEQLRRIAITHDIGWRLGCWYGGEEVRKHFYKKRDELLIALLPQLDSSLKISAIYTDVSNENRPQFAKRGIVLCLEELGSITSPDEAKRFLEASLVFGDRNAAAVMAMKKWVELTDDAWQLAIAIMACFHLRNRENVNVVSDYELDLALEKFLINVTDHELMFEMYANPVLGMAFHDRILAKWHACDLTLADLKKLFGEYSRGNDVKEPKIVTILKKWEEVAIASIEKSSNIAQLKELLPLCYQDGEARKMIIRKAFSQ